MPHSTRQIQLDVAVIGGGIAGLWLINRLLDAGYDAALLESRALGGVQSIASQGMIHGGIKYSLSGQLSGTSAILADMPSRWRAALAGEGELDLRQTRLLSDKFYLWSSGGIASNLQAMLASRALQGRVSALSQQHYPELLKNPRFAGKVYQLDDLVLDLPSLVANLADKTRRHLAKVDLSSTRLVRDDQGQVSIMLETSDGPLEVLAQKVILASGRGNAALLAQLNLTEPRMQIRPLQQVMIKHAHPQPFYGHCLGLGTSPRLTISSHPMADGEQVWYLGGKLAEIGAELSPSALISYAQAELAELLPWVDLTQARWACLTVERAEARQPNLNRPDGPSLIAAPKTQNLEVAWPTKLTLAPHLADMVMQGLQRAGLEASGTRHSQLLAERLGAPAIAPPPWEQAFRESQP